MGESNHKVLISAAGAGNAFAAVMALRKNFPDNFILTIDTNPAHLVTTSVFSDRHLISPELKDKDYSGFLIKTINDFSIDTYVPFIDTDIKVASKLWTDNQISQKVSLQVKNPQFAEICENKLLTYQFLIENNLPSPETAPIDKPFPAEEYVLKPIGGFGSNVRILSKDQLQKIGNKENFIIQEKCESPEITIDVTYSPNKKIFHYICRERIQTKAGVCTKARLFQDEYLSNLAFTIAQLLDLHSFCFQVMKLKGNWVITDINPRLGAGTALCTAAGSDFFSAMFAILWNEDPSIFLNDLNKECYVTRQYAEYLMS